MTTQTGGDEQTLDATISALQGGLTSINPASAVGVIDTWRQTLSGAGLTDIVSDLDDLKSALTGGVPNGSRIGSILSSLGSKTTAASGSAPANYQSKLDQLGQLLTKAGSSLGS